MGWKTIHCRFCLFCSFLLLRRCDHCDSQDHRRDIDLNRLNVARDGWNSFLQIALPLPIIRSACTRLKAPIEEDVQGVETFMPQWYTVNYWLITFNNDEYCFMPMQGPMSNVILIPFQCRNTVNK